MFQLQKKWMLSLFALPLAAWALSPADALAGAPKFQSATPAYTFDGFVADMIFADLNDDGNPDVVIANTTDNRIEVRYGNNDGSFPSSTTETYPAGSLPRYLVAADFNGDGMIDIGVSAYHSNQIYILLNGAQGLASAVGYTTGSGSGPNGLAAADLDGDGRLDLAVAANDSNQLVVLYGRGDGTFEPPVSFAVGSYPSALTVADFNNDSRPDIAVSNDGSSSISILLNGGTGRADLFVSNVRIAGEVSTPAGILSRDLDHDGNVDLAVAENGGAGSGGSAAVLLGNGDGSFRGAVHYGNEAYVMELVSGDYDHDGKVDLAVSGPNVPVQILSGDGDGGFALTATYPPGGLLASGDLNRDELPDLATFWGSSAQFWLSRAEGTLAFGSLTYSVSENGGNAVVTVNRADSAYGRTTLSIRTIDGTASAGSDYAAVNDTITFNDGETTKSYSIPIFDNSAISGDRNFEVEISDPTNEAVLGAWTSSTVTIEEDDMLSANADLNGLELDGASLNPGFSPLATSYSTSVASGVASLRVKPTASDAHALIEARVNGSAYAAVATGMPSAPLALNAGLNTIDVRLTAEDGLTRQTYTITVTRTAPLTNNEAADNGAFVPRVDELPPASNELRSFSLQTNEGAKLQLTPAFDKDQFRYRAETEASRLVIHLETIDPLSAVLWNGQTVNGPVAIELQAGDNSFVFSVRAPNGTLRAYTLTIRRLPLQDQPDHSASLHEFSDVKGHWAEESIREAVEKGIVDGYSSDTFRPDEPVTRLEFAVMLSRALGLSAAQATDAHSFADAADIPSWATNVIAAAVEHGLLSGYTDGSLRPLQPISRAEMAAMLVKSADWETEDTRTAFRDDANLPAWSRGYIQAAASYGLLLGRSGNRFEPNASATRAESAAVLLRLLQSR